MSRSSQIILTALCIFLKATAGAQEAPQKPDTTQKIVTGRTNSITQQKKPYVILISADGFRYDLAEKYQAKNLLKLSDGGVQAAYMQASFPSLTFPNLYSIVTGLYPSHHGIVDNSFYDEKKQLAYTMGNRKAVSDSSWYGGTPLWVLAEKQQMLTASFYWVASESAIQGVRPTYYYIYNEAIPIDQRIETVKNWLQLPEDKRPHFITFYFPEVDHQEHRFGVDSKEAIDAVHFVDESVGKLVRAVDSTNLPVNFIFLSDHGMMNIDTTSFLSLPAVVDTGQFRIVAGLTVVHLYAKDSSAIAPAFAVLKKQAMGYVPYLATDMRPDWHYSKQDDRFDRIGDIILVADPPKVFNINHRRLPAAEHGYDPFDGEMRASFYAWGPAFEPHKKIDGFENVNVYPLIAEILGLKNTEAIDGKPEVLQSILKKKE